MAEPTAAPTNGVPVVKVATPKPVEDVVNYSKRSIDDSEFFADIPPDELLEAMNDDSEPEKPRRARPQPERGESKPKARKPEPEPEEEEDDEPLAAAADDAEPADEASDQDADAEAEPKAWTPPEGKGTKEAPLTLKDLPSDLFVELTVNGEKIAVDLKEAGKGYMRRQAFDQQISKAKQGLTDAHDIAEKAVVAQERMKDSIDKTRQGFEVFIKDPKRVLNALFDNVADKRRIVEALIEDHEDAYEEISFAYAEFRQREDALAKDGYQQSRARRAKDRDQRRYQREQAALDDQRRQIAEDRQRLEQEQTKRKQNEETSARQKAAQQAAFVKLKPGLDAGLLALGLRELSPEHSKELGIRLGVVQRRKGTEPLTADDVKQAVIRSAQDLDIKATPASAARPAPAPGNGAPRRAATPPERKPTNGANGRFESVPQNQRVRDLDWYMNGG